MNPLPVSEALLLVILSIFEVFKDVSLHLS